MNIDELFVLTESDVKLVAAALKARVFQRKWMPDGTLAPADPDEADGQP